MVVMLCIVVIFLLFIIIDNKKGNWVSSQLVAPVVSAFVRSLAAFAARGGLVRAV